MKPALLIGSTCVDIIINLPHLPVTQEDVHPTAQTMAIGGCSYNVAYTVRLLGAPHTHISPVGTRLYECRSQPLGRAYHVGLMLRLRADRRNAKQVE